METQTTDISYQVKTTVFEGPFGLLLKLIEDKKLFINDISLSLVTDDYLNYVKNLGDFKREDVANFISIATTLILIKSKSILPKLDLLPEEERDILDLENRLNLYKLYSELSIDIKEKFGKNIIFPFLPTKNKTIVFLPDGQITNENMNSILTNLLGKIPQNIFLPEVEMKKVINIEDVISSMIDRISNSLEINFKEFGKNVKTKEEKVYVIVNFLAMLELVRTGLIDAMQENNFEDIIMNKNNIN